MPLSLYKIHHAVATAARPRRQEQANRNAQDSGNNILRAVTQDDTSPFHEALHEYSLFARPSSTQDVASLSNLVNQLIHLCGTSNDAWKVFVLTAFLRRYHEKAPEAKASDDESVGDGERLVFYGTLLELHHYWQANNISYPEQARLAFEAGAAMIRIAARIGGTRDLCAIIEHLALANLKREGLLEGEAAPESFADKLVPAVRALAVNGKPDDLLELALGLAAQQLDQDLRMLKSEGGAKECLSTIHVKLPHNQRGSNTKGAWQRKLANCAAEVLIWQRSTVAQEDPRFGRTLTKLKALTTSKDSALKLIQQVQMNARKQRQLLNNHARNEGFLVSSSYQLDKSSLTLRHIRRAKVGDLSLLKKLASKNKDSRVLSLIAKRNMNPDKATSIESIQELASGWMDIHKDYGDDEVAALELAMQTSTLQATLTKLKSQATRPALVTCVGTDRDNVLCAILVAASLGNSRLVLSGDDHDVSTTEKCLFLLNQVLVDGAFTTDEAMMSAEDVLPLLSGNQDAIILSSGDLGLDEAVLKDMEARGITLHVHSTKKIEAEIGQVELCLNSTVYNRIKARQPLTLSVVLDCTGSMGAEIDGCKKGALKMISKFRELAPVETVNIMGYWDPVNVSSDPLPKSTGFLDTAEKNTSAALQRFVDTQLKCQGGGDEPEDIPLALERLLEEMKKRGLSAHERVNLVFFIADAGFRPNENARVQRALDSLKQLGVVMVMCRVRGGRNLQTFVDRLQDTFQGAGQYAEINGVGQLESIAASVTESIRASLFKSSNVVSVTASSGSTLDALRKLANFQADHAKLEETKELAKLPDEEMEEAGVFATKEFSLTSRDRLYLQLSRLPALCHESVGTAFGGKSLQEMSAAAIAARLRSHTIPLAELKRAGYPGDVVDLVRNLVAGYGVKRFEEEVASVENPTLGH